MFHDRQWGSKPVLLLANVNPLPAEWGADKEKRIEGERIVSTLMERRPMASGIEHGVVFSQIRLPIAGESVAYARQFVKATFGAWSLSGDEDAELLVSEIVTNVVRHVGTSDHPMCVSVVRRDDRVRIEVHDPSSERPRPRKAGELDESGHGLYLVEVISADWGCAQLDQVGKVVWCEVYA